MYALAKPLLFALDAERAHHLSLRALDLAQACGAIGLLARPPAPLPVSAFGLSFPNPVGLAAGLDKNAAHIDALGALGFGFVEVGTVTPKPQWGNPKPRMFRLPTEQAIINRLGFNNLGVDALLQNLQRAQYKGVLGINIGKNKDTANEDAVKDYLWCLDRVYERASYITVNISSPNTQGLRDLQDQDPLHRLLATLRERQEALGALQGQRKPMLLKIAPDLDDDQLDSMAEVLTRNAIDGVICTNTTISRAAVPAHPLATETGGLSGRPLMSSATRSLRAMSQRLGPRIVLIGVGGICSGADAVAKLDAGASLVQLYSGLVFRGPGLVRECVEAVRAR